MCHPISTECQGFCSFIQERWNAEPLLRLLLITVVAIAIITLLAITLA